MKRLHIKFSIGGIIFLGIVIREMFSFWTGHPWDFEVWVRVGYYVAAGSNPYVYLDPIDGLSFSGYNILPSVGYPPLWAFACAFFYRLFILLGAAHRFVYYFLLKQPSILGDVLLGYLLFCIIREKGDLSKAISALWFWMLCPFTIIISSLWGMFDSLVMVLIVGALILFRQVKKSGLLIGVGIFLKVLPVIYLPVLTIFRKRRESAIFLFISIVTPLFFSVLPFYLFGWDISGFTQCMVSQGSRVGEGLTFWSVFELFNFLPQAKVFLGYVSGALSLIWIPALLSTYIYILVRCKGLGSFQDVIQSLLIITFVFFLSRLYIPEQFVIYAIALMLIDVNLWHPGRRTLFHVTWVLALVYLVLNNTLLIRFLSPVAPWAWGIDFQLNNAPPTATVRYIMKLILSFIFSVSIVQNLLITWRKDGFREPWLLNWVKEIFRTRNIPYLFYFTIFLFTMSLTEIILGRLIPNWSWALEEKMLGGISHLGMYHLVIAIVTLCFNWLFCVFRQKSGFLLRLRAFFTLLFLDILALPFSESAYRILTGRTPLAGDLIFTVSKNLMIDNRVFASLGLVLGLFGLLGVKMFSSAQET